jgi:chromosome segregation ATPase
MPRLPDKWGDSERQFGIGLRDLFDTIYSDQETQDRNTEDNGARIDETNEKFNKAVSEINDHLHKTDDKLEDTIERVDDLEERMEAIDGEEGRMAAAETRLNAIDGEDGALDVIDGRLDAAEGRLDVIDGTGGRLDTVEGAVADKIDIYDAYPIGIAVFAGSSSDLPSGLSWSPVYDSNNDQIELGGKYMWERV